LKCHIHLRGLPSKDNPASDADYISNAARISAA
jgi:hypothetical protein